MFATRSNKSKKNKRKRVVEEEDGAGAAPGGGDDGGAGSRGTAGDAAAEDEEADDVVLPAAADRRKLNMFSTGSAKRTRSVITESRQIASEREIVPQAYAGDATYESQIDTEKDRDARAILERNIQANAADGSAASESGKVYRGQAGYKNYITKNEAAIGMNKYTGTQGPIRAQTWARSICRFDYQPDVCKDYKETGFCGYGDSCKFLHDRGDYKSGWQIEKEYAEKEKKRQERLQQGLASGPNDDEDDDKYVIHSDEEDEEDGGGGQFACTICRQPFTNAVETLCGHFFCEQCALRQFKKSSRCFNCKKQTNGVFHAAEKLRERERERRAAQAAAEEEDQEEDVDDQE